MPCSVLFPVTPINSISFLHISVPQLTQSAVPPSCPAGTTQTGNVEKYNYIFTRDTADVKMQVKSVGKYDRAGPERFYSFKAYWLRDAPPV